MKERPILLNAEMVRAVLDGRKTQTRRVIKCPAKSMQETGQLCIRENPNDDWYKNYRYSMRDKDGTWNDYTEEEFIQLSPYGVPGDRLWVRETWRPEYTLLPDLSYEDTEILEIHYVADGFSKDCTFEAPGGWVMPIAARKGNNVPSIHMPRWASRITLEITGVRVERVQDISEEDAKAEGYDFEAPVTPKDWFSILWDSINDKRGYGWDANPWVWVVEFRKLGDENTTTGG